ncbi:MAG TPA: alcohol dehydrogenase catalytic domain-containing protein [Dehalococcoidia bacterium]|jgi:D-arabinose 1-dehydrogenase-like Zn-dependent alcohol dehydrogenase|nr:alcohol dehydrogenase catalytic domain-containing protein [Dehalococcoidia bacterium]
MATSMRAAVWERPGEPLALRDRPIPEIGPNDVLVEVKASGVCFTDLRVIDGRPEGDAFVPGHESVGVIAAVGAEAGDQLRPGARVAVHPQFACGECSYCEAGEDEACVLGTSRFAGLSIDGGYAQFLRVPADRTVPLPDALDFADAAPFCCAGITVYAALRNGGIEPGQRVAVIGIGGLGHLAISIAAVLGAEVYAVTNSPDKVEVARERGAVWAGDAAAAAEELAGRGGANIVLNTANVLDPVGTLLPGIARQGAIVLAAADGDVLPVPPGMFIGLQLRVIGSFFGSRDDLRDVLELAVRHEIRPQIETHQLDEVNAVHARLRANEIRFRAVLTP